MKQPRTITQSFRFADFGVLFVVPFELADVFDVDPAGTLFSRWDGGPGVLARRSARPRGGRGGGSSSSSELSCSSLRSGSGSGSARALPFPFTFGVLEGPARLGVFRGWGVGGSGRSCSSNLNETRLPRERLRCPAGTEAGRSVGDEVAGEEGMGEEGGSVLFENVGSYE